MTAPSYPDNEPAWVEDSAHRGHWALRWLDKAGKPSDEIGVLREADVPGIHTSAAAQRILAMPLIKQAARLWAPAPKAG